MSLEVALCAALTTLWWASSVSVLLPFVLALRFSKRFQYGWFSWLHSKFLASTIQPKQVPFRKRCFQMLQDNMKSRDPSTPLRILEIGIGSGENLQFYPENSTLIALDMNPSFQKYFEENKQNYPNVMLERMVITMAEDMNDIPDNSVDVAISTYVLCSVQDVEAVLQELRRVLVPDGKFAFLEHVAFPETQWSSTIQKVVSPLWSLYFAGCDPHRNIGVTIDNAGFSSVNYEKNEQLELLLFVRPQITGIARK